MKNSTLKYLLVLFTGAALSMTAWAADVVVIINKDNTNAVDKEFVVKVYTGVTKNWSDGSPIFSLDQGEENQVRVDFYSSVMGKTSGNMKALWAQNIFSGKGLPPKVFDPDSEVKKVVSANKNAIGYIKSSSVDDTVKVAVK